MRVNNSVTNKLEIIRSLKKRIASSKKYLRNISSSIPPVINAIISCRYIPFNDKWVGLNVGRPNLKLENNVYAQKYTIPIERPNKILYDAFIPKDLSVFPKVSFRRKSKGVSQTIGFATNSSTHSGRRKMILYPVHRTKIMRYSEKILLNPNCNLLSFF